MEGPWVSGHWLGVWGGNANALPRPPFNLNLFRVFFRVALCSCTDSSFAGDVAIRQTLDAVRTVEIVWTEFTRSSNKHVLEIRIKWMRSKA